MVRCAPVASFSLRFVSVVVCFALVGFVGSHCSRVGIVVFIFSFVRALFVVFSVVFFWVVLVLFGCILTIQAILPDARGVEAVSMTSRESVKTIPFPFLALGLGNRSRYPPVSLFFGMRRWSQAGRGVQEHLFDSRGPRSVAERRVGMAEQRWKYDFFDERAVSKGYANFSGPAGGRSLALAAPLWQARGL